MENIQFDVSPDGSKITITLDAGHRGQRSASGKSTRVASTEGNVSIPGTDITIGINAYVK